MEQNKYNKNPKKPYNKSNNQKQNNYHNNNENHNIDHINDTKVYALGGLNEVGKNMYCIEHQDEIIIIDSGVKFGEDELPGIDYIIPDYSYLVRNSKKIKALIITHGHEDHIGGIPFLIQTLPVPFIYATPLATELIKRKLDEKRLTNQTKFILINDQSKVVTKHFNIGFFKTNHSIPESMGIVINTPNGRIVTTGDFKFDLTPVGEKADLDIMAFLGMSGVTLLMSDSTNAEVENFSVSERKVATSVRDIFRKTEGRLIVATFASNVHRVQQIIEAALKFDRKIMVFGRSMENVIQTSRKLGYIKAPEAAFIKPEEARRLPDEKILILCTGSQGETLAALSRIANGTHRHIHIKPGDTVIFSSSPIPGNGASVNRVVNRLTRGGAKVITNALINTLHTSGHASQEELKLMMLLLKPKYFFPVHGEYRMLKIHSQLAQEVGIPEENTFVLGNGDVLYLRDETVFRGPRVHADDIYVDGNDITGLSTAVIRDRKILSEDGLVSVVIAMDSRTGVLLSRPVIVSRGFVYMKDNFDMIREAEYKVQAALTKLIASKTTFGEIKNTVRDTLSAYFYEKTKRNPMIIPVVMNKK